MRPAVTSRLMRRWGCRGSASRPLKSRSRRACRVACRCRGAGDVASHASRCSAMKARTERRAAASSLSSPADDDGGSCSNGLPPARASVSTWSDNAGSAQRSAAVTSAKPPCELSRCRRVADMSRSVRQFRSSDCVCGIDPWPTEATVRISLGASTRLCRLCCDAGCGARYERLARVTFGRMKR